MAIMNLEKSLNLCEKYGFYKNLLTEKQKTIFESYFFDDIGLTEISENLGITKQTVLDTLKKTQKNLEMFDEKLKITEIYSKQKNLIENIKQSKNLSEIDKILSVWED